MRVKGIYDLSYYERLSEDILSRVSKVDYTEIISYRNALVNACKGVPQLLYRMFSRGSLEYSLFKYTATNLFFRSWISKNSQAGRKFIEISERDPEDKSTAANIVLEHISNFLDDFDVKRAVASPLAYTILTTLSQQRELRRKSMPMVSGSRIAISSKLGGGKTTFTFWSCYAVLRYLGYGHEEALSIFDSLAVNNEKDLLMMFHFMHSLFSKELMLPFIVIDDAAVIASKYLMSPGANKEERQRAITLINFLQVSREGVGCMILNAPPELLLKGIRDIVDSTFESITIKDKRVWTIWYELKEGVIPRGKIPGIDSPYVGRSKILMNVTATIHPPMLTPTDLYRKLEWDKIHIRKEILNKLKSQISNQREGKKKEAKVV